MGGNIHSMKLGQSHRPDTRSVVSQRHAPVKLSTRSISSSHLGGVGLDLRGCIPDTSLARIIREHTLQANAAQPAHGKIR
jgi:hypothetical protein